LLVRVHVRFKCETMSSLQQAVEIFVTCIENDGPLLKLWGQLDRTQATTVERLILQLREQFERGLVIPSAVNVGQLCCARYNDGVYYRARVTSPADMSVGRVAVHFIDYGNSEVVPLSDIRSLEANSLTTMLASVSDQATDFFLAGILPLAGAWDENSLAFIRQALCYEELKSVVVAQIANKRLIKVFYNNEDFAQILIASKIGVSIAIHAQQALIQAYYGLDSAMPLFPGFTVPPPSRMLLNHLRGQTLTMPPPLPAIRMDCNSQNMLGNTPSFQETAGIFTTPVLELNSEHMVYVSYVEDGPLSFAVQLQATEGTLSSVMDELNKSPPVHFTQPLMPGSVCLGRFTEDQTLYRAVVVNVLDDKCRLYYVDFGNSEVVPYSEIFELPKQFFIPEVMALHFALAGLKNLTVTEDIKSYFKELVTEKLLRLRVIPPEGPPIKQYGELHLNGTNVLDLLIQKMKEKQVPCNFPVMPIPQVGTTDSVKVSYMIYASNFYVQLEINAEALKSVMLAVEAVCTGVAPLLADQLQVGLPCCAQYSEDGKWYRAKILSLSSNLVEVLYVDYGNTDCVSLSSVKPIDPSLVKILNTQAIPCCLFGFQDNMNEYLAAKFEEITLDKTLTLVVMDKLPNDVILVELFDDSKGSHVNVGAQLLSIEKAQESTRTQSQLPVYKSTTEDSGECLKNDST
jgi:Tudor domain.